MADLYDPPFRKKTARRLIVAARAHLAGLSLIEEDTGFAAPENCPLDLHLRTVLMALQCALEMEDWSTVAEAYVMLQDAERRTRT